MHSIKPKGFGVIIRTVAEGRRVAELDQELRILLSRWETALANVQNSNPADKATLVYEETSRTVGLLRDLFNPSFESIHINDKQVYEEVRDYVALIAPESKDIVKLYKGNVPIFDNFSVTRQIKSSLGRTVTYKHGAYLIIEHTEALHVVDINSGNRSKSPEGQEVNALDAISAPPTNSPASSVCAIWAVLSSSISSTWRNPRTARSSTSEWSRI